MANDARPAPVTGLAALAASYRYLVCDVWGVVHNGAEALPEAGRALSRFRQGGGVVILLTNAPRLKSQVAAQLDRFGVDRAAYDDIVTSGEATRAWLAGHPGERVYHLGAGRDLPLYTDLDLTLTDAAQATLLCCTGLFDDEVETPEDYDERLSGFAARGLTMLCANPDLVVERGSKLVWCAGALAARYREIGGNVVIFGKPHAPVYATVLARLAELAERPIERAAVLAIGDGLETDVRGANQAGLDVLFITAGIHAGSFGERESPRAEAIHSILAGSGLGARAYIPRLVW